MKKELFAEFINGLIVMLFLYAAFSKIADHMAFVRAMDNQPFPGYLRVVIVNLLPPAEILTSLLITFRRTRRIGLYCFLTLMTLFSIYISMALLKVFPFTPCPCGGIFTRLQWPGHLALNIVFVILGFVSLKFTRKSTDSNSKGI